MIRIIKWNDVDIGIGKFKYSTCHSNAVAVYFRKEDVFSYNSSSFEILNKICQFMYKIIFEKAYVTN